MDRGRQHEREGHHWVNRRLPKDERSQWNLPAGIMDNFLHNTANVAIALGIVECTKLGRGLVVMGVRFELVHSDTKLDGGLRDVYC